MEQGLNSTIMVWARKRNGVGVILKGECATNVVEVKRALDRVMTVKLEIAMCVLMDVVSGYVPRRWKRKKFWRELNEVVESIPMEERTVWEQTSIGM